MAVSAITPEEHDMNVTWVSRPIPEDRASEEELCGEFYNSAVLQTVGAQ